MHNGPWQLPFWRKLKFLDLLVILLKADVQITFRFAHQTFFLIRKKSIFFSLKRVDQALSDLLEILNDFTMNAKLSMELIDMVNVIKKTPYVLSRP